MIKLHNKYFVRASAYGPLPTRNQTPGRAELFALLALYQLLLPHVQPDDIIDVYCGLAYVVDHFPTSHIGPVNYDMWKEDLARTSS